VAVGNFEIRNEGGLKRRQDALLLRLCLTLFFKFFDCVRDFLIVASLTSSQPYCTPE